MKSIIDNDRPTVAVLAASSSTKRLLRGPLFWLLGVASLASLGVWCGAILWNSPSVVVADYFLPLIMSLSAAILSGVAYWTYICFVLFWNDCYQALVQPKLSTLLLVALQWSLDDVLQLVWDPTQLMAGASMCLTLYTLPTTPAERARVLAAAGLLGPVVALNGAAEDDVNDETTEASEITVKTANHSHNNSTTTTSSSSNISSNSSATEILTTAGGWKVLLPHSMQELVHRVVYSPTLGHGNEMLRGHVTTKSTKTPTTLCEDASTDDEDEEDAFVPPLPTQVDEHLPRSSATTTSTTPTAEQMPRVPQQQLQLGTVDDEMYNLLKRMLQDTIQAQLNQVCDMLGRQSKLIPTSVAASAIALVLTQLRHFPRARAMGASLAHLAVFSLAGTAFSTSLVALSAPQLHRYRTNQTAPSSTIPPQELRQMSLAFVDSMLRSLLSCAKNFSLPPSLSLKQPSISKLAHYLYHWKGTVAVWVLAYFQYRRSTRQRIASEAKR